MRCKKLLLLILLLFVCFNGFSAVFVVTSNADSGPGTLRDALTQAAANGSAEKDYINFNLADLSEAGRTITVLSRLPDVSSNLVIDGTTQPGLKLGISDAKIIITIGTQSYPDSFVCFYTINNSNIEIDGLYFSLIGARDTNGTAIFFKNASNIIIGQPGKGNVFGMVDQDVELLSCYHITVSANWFGIDPNTSMPAYTPWSGNLAIYSSGDIRIGGDTRPEGNIFVAAQNERESLINGSDPETASTTVVDHCVVKNNTLGYWANDIKVHAFLNLEQIQNLEVQDNLINYSSGFLITDIRGELLIQGNQCNVDEVHPDKNSSAATPFELFTVKKAIIGGPEPGDANTVINNGYPGNGYEAINTYQCNDILIQRNSIGCKTPLPVYVARESKVELPVVSISNVSGTQLKGKATPGSEIEVFSDSQCQMCEPTNYLGSAIAGTDSLWSFIAPGKSSGYTASASINGRTSLFAKVGLDMTIAVVRNPSCGDNNGSIKGITVVNTTKTEWTDQSGKVVSNNIDIDNLPPGTYTFTAWLGEFCNVKSDTFTLTDTKPQFDDTFLNVRDNSCGQKNGSVEGLGFKNQTSFTTQTLKWVDQSGQTAGNGLNLESVAAGSYTFSITTTDGCTVTYGPVVIKNTTGPNIDQSNQTIQATPCGQSAGSISNLIIAGTGTLKYSWLNSQQQEVGTDKDLQNQPAGTYKLQVTDNAECPIYSTDIVIPETNGITMDESKAQTTIAMCGLDNGSITGILVTGAGKYVWAYGNNTVATTTPDLLNMPPGDYVLTASNNFGCTKTSQSYHIGQQLATKFPVYASVVVPSCFKGNDGSVAVTTDALVKSLRWVDGQGQNAGTNTTLAGIGAGAYQLYLTGQNGCESFYNTYTITEFPEYTVALYGTVTTDKCGLNTGGVSATTIAGGVPPYTYQWRDANNNPLAATNAISNLSAGTYILNVVDTRCGNVDITYTITEDTEAVPVPSVSNVQLCSAGSAIIKVNNPAPSLTYRLYDNPVSPHVVDEQKGGSFKVNVTANQSFYISQLNGTCESERAEVQVAVGLYAKDIVNTFTPNGDGINDYWKINSIESYPQANIQVFTRNGQLVFNSIGYAHPFDGTFNSKKLPAGVYYYVINLGTSCKILSGNLTIIR